MRIQTFVKILNLEKTLRHKHSTHFFSVYKVLILNDKIKKQGQWVKNMYTVQNINALMNKRQGIKQKSFYKIVLIITTQLILFCINN